MSKMLQASAYWATRRRVFFSPPAPDEDSRVGRGDRRWGVERALEAVVPALERALVAGPHPVGQPQRLLQTLEPLRRAGIGDAQAAVLLLVPGRADAEPGPPTREDVEGGHRLDEQSRVTVGHAGDERAEADVPCDTCGVGERRVALEHLVLRRADHGDLEEVVHDPEAGHAGVVGVAGDPGKGGADARRGARPGEVGDL